MEDLTDAQWLINIAKIKRSLDIFESKAWTLTAEILYPNDMFVIYDTYEEAKNAGEFEEAGALLEKMLNMGNDEGGKLAEEITNFIESLNDGNEMNTKNAFYRKFYERLSGDMKKAIILFGANRTDDIEKYGLDMLTLFEKFPEAVNSHGMELLERLMNFCGKAQSNPEKAFIAKKLLVSKVTPCVLGQRLSFRKETLITLLKYAFERHVTDQLGPTAGSQHLTQTFGSTASALYPSAPSETFLRDVFQSVGEHLDWELANVFSKYSNETEMLREIRGSYRKNLENKTYAGNQEVFYAILCLFLQSLGNYLASKSMAPSRDCPSDTLPLTLIRNLGDHESTVQGCHVFSPVVATLSRDNVADFKRHTAAAIQNLMIAIDCYKLISDDVTFMSGFQEICQPISDARNTWYDIFLRDSNMATRSYDIINNVCRNRVAENAKPNHYLRLNDAVQDTILFFRKNQVKDVIGSIYEILDVIQDSGLVKDFKLKPFAKLEPIGTNGSHIVSKLSDQNDDLLFIPLAGDILLNFTSQILTRLLKDCLDQLITSLAPTDPHDRLNQVRKIDKTISCLLVLSQLDELWSKGSLDWIKIIEAVHKRGNEIWPFTFHSFFVYVYRVDFLEEIAYLLEELKVPLELFPTTPPDRILEETSNNSTTTTPLRKSMRKCVTKSVGFDNKDEIKKVLIRQVQSLPIEWADTRDFVYSTVLQFFLHEKELIMESLVS